MDVAVYTHPDMLAHSAGEGHPERPARLQAVLGALEDGAARIEVREAPQVAREDLLRVHPQTYIDAIAGAEPARGLVQLDPDTAMSPGSLVAAERACGAAATRLPGDMAVSGSSWTRPRAGSAPAMASM